MKSIKTILFMCGSLFLLGACVKKDPISHITQVLMVPLSPDAIAVDFRINNGIMATTVGYSSTTGTASYTLPYYTVNAGNTVVSYNVTGSTTAYASNTFTAVEDNAYSTFFIDSVSRAKAVLVNDDLTAPSPGKVKVRFFNFSPNAGGLDISNSATGYIYWRNRTFNDQATTKEYENFIEVDPGSYTFKFLTTGTSTAAYTTTALTFLPDRIYTLAARGVVGGASNKALGAIIYPNKAN